LQGFSGERSPLKRQFAIGKLTFAKKVIQGGKNTAEDKNQFD